MPTVRYGLRGEQVSVVMPDVARLRDDALPALRLRVCRERHGRDEGAQLVDVATDARRRGAGAPREEGDPMIHPPADEALERLWYQRENGRDVHFESPDDEERARGIVRRHRLAEILFAQVLEVDLKDAEE